MSSLCQAPSIDENVCGRVISFFGSVLTTHTGIKILVWFPVQLCPVISSAIRPPFVAVVNHPYKKKKEFTGTFLREQAYI